MSANEPVTEGQLDAKLRELRESLEGRIDARNAELRACIEKRLNDHTKRVIGWMTVMVLGAAGLVIGLV